MHRSHLGRIAGCLFSTLAVPLTPFESPAQLGVRWRLNEVAGDFSVSEGHPLIKTKFSLYDPQGPTLEQFDRDVDLLSELNVDSYRIELAWGGAARPGVQPRAGEIGGTRDLLTYDFSGLERLVRGLQSQNVRLLSSYGYTPVPLQNPDYSQSPRSAPPTDMAKWGEVVATFARHPIPQGHCAAGPV